MGVAATVTDLLNSTLDAVKSVVPVQSNRNSGPSLVEGSFVQSDTGVLIGLAGDLPGRLILNASRTTFTNLGTAMFGVALEGEMVESFVGEVGNMVAGNAVSALSEAGLILNITPPTVLVGETKIAGFQHGIKVSLELENTGELTIILIIDEK